MAISIQNLWYAKDKALLAHEPLVVYLQRLGTEMLVLIPMLLMIILYLCILYVLRKHSDKSNIFIISVFFGTAIIGIISFIEYPVLLGNSLYLMLICLMTLTSGIASFYLIRLNLSNKTNRTHIYYRLINYYIYSLAIVALIQFSNLFIVYLYFGELPQTSGLHYPFELNLTIIKVILVYYLVVFMVSIFCGGKLWRFETKTRLLLQLFMLFTICYQAWLLYFSISDFKLNYTIITILFIFINGSCLYYTNRHPFPNS
jgi:hypothetical protein